MTTEVVRRPARLEPPQVPAERIALAEPPRLEQKASNTQGMGMILMPVIGGTGSLLIALTNQGRPLFVATGLLFMVASVSIGALVFLGQRGAGRRRLREDRERYLDYIDGMRDRLREATTAQRAAAEWLYPGPDRLVDLARNPARLWERRPSDEDFLTVRIGRGAVPLGLRLSAPVEENPLSNGDPISVAAATHLVARRSTLEEQPITVDLKSTGVLTVIGDRRQGRDLARALVAQLTALHSPDDVHVAVAAAPPVAGEWEWAKWLPHLAAPDLSDGVLGGRLFADTVSDLGDLIAGDIESRVDAYRRTRGRAALPGHLVVIVDGEYLPTTAGIPMPDPSLRFHDFGLHVIYLLAGRGEEPSDVDVRVAVGHDGLLSVARSRESASAGSVDPVRPGDLAALSRVLAPMRIAAEDSGTVLTSTVELTEILGVPDVAHLRPEQTWVRRAERDFLRVPIGVGSDGRPVMLDVKESARGGMGPHGLVVGATGSGKSELLRTLVTSLAISHHPDQLALVLVDFKGGATFAGMADLPHLAGMVTNLADDLSLVDRFRDALFGEMQRRQEALKAAGNLPNVQAYDALREERPELPPLPHLLVIIDEFSELLTAKPDFSELFVAIGRIGRSIGVHLLLATQRLEVGKIRGLESHLSYRICLRTFSEAESREAIGTPDAYNLPPEPGSGFLKVDTTVFDRFKAALVSAPYRAPAEASPDVLPVVPFTATNGAGAIAEQLVLAARKAKAQESRGPESVTAATVLDVAVRRLADTGIAVHRVWLPPVEHLITLDQVLANAEPPPPGAVCATFGVVDEPKRQRISPLRIDFTGAQSNLVVVGAPQSGKTTLLRSMLLSMAMQHTPEEVAFYVIDYGGSGLSSLSQLPHTGVVCSRVEPERVRRAVSEAAGLLARREMYFRANGLDSAASWRAWRAAGNRFGDDSLGDVMLVIDGWGGLREDMDDVEQMITDIAARGAGYGVHVVLSVVSGSQVRPRMQASFGGRLELRLNDAFDSQIGRKLMGAIPGDVPGRGLTTDELYFQAALPRTDGSAAIDDLAEAHRDAVRAIADAWPGAPVPPVRVLPLELAWHHLPEPGKDLRPGVPIGISETDLRPTYVDFAADPHLLVLGDGETGKTNLLRVLINGLVARRSREEVGFIVVDYRRSLLDVVPKEYLLAYCTAAPTTAQVAKELHGQIAMRLPPADVTAEQLRSRSWWKGPDVFVIVDDYDLVVTSSGNPLGPLVEFLPQARDVGLHLVVSRRTGGMARAGFESMIQRLGDLATPGLMFSGDRAEGRLVGGVASQRLPTGRALSVGRGRPPVQVQTVRYDSTPGV